MKKMKWWILVILVCLLSGCSVDYHLYIGNPSTKEEVKVYLNEFTDEQLDDIIWGSTDTAENAMGDYQYSIFKEQGNKGIKLLLKKGNDVFLRSRFLKVCYDNVDVVRNNSSIKIETTDKFLCYDRLANLGNVTINIHVAGNLVRSNADRIQGEVYSWNFTNKNKNRKIYLEIDNLKANEEIDVIKPPKKDPDAEVIQNISNGMLTIVIIAIVIAILVIVGVAYFVIKNKKINKL